MFRKVSPDYFFDHLQISERQKFFSIFYMSINAGSLLSTVITPILRGEHIIAYTPSEARVTVLMLLTLDSLLQATFSVSAATATLWPSGFLQL